jgi:hypothetical protein
MVMSGLIFTHYELQSGEELSFYGDGQRNFERGEIIGLWHDRNNDTDRSERIYARAIITSQHSDKDGLFYVVVL